MKTIALFTFFLFANYSSVATKDFELVTDKDELILAHSASQQLHLSLIRAKGYQKASAKMGLSSSLPSGVAVQFDPKEGVMNDSEVIITADSTAKPGTYSLIINSTINHKTKGTVLKLVIE